ncbi:PEP/pyruvate-binding domain-containing protein [Paucibacter sp. APW11]|uniref:PEP/pyruvate-binding domain-containing protein n=1 Tax=Roseateles aquae TaxID=3077235 RepID=A0ABU3PFH8_9BURK|nr:PEP/pyruvate-binding domain-containing protein [Paucibacter sp. APW11]MDT9001077.1 PEP/pyruvate-binding domain-containing protein [Paucibacter sp. APW11]
MNQQLLSAPVCIACGPETATPPPEAIGFKAHNLARMAALGLAVPPAFVIGTAWCQQADELTPAHWLPALAAVEARCGLRFGDPRRPLLLSVRSGAPVSMPGMLESLLNIGLCDATLPGLLRRSGNPRLAWDAYRRLVAGFGTVVWGLPMAAFEADLARVAQGRAERELDFLDLRALTRAHLDTLQRLSGRSFPQSPQLQLQQAIDAVFASWQSDKARAYRAMKQIDEAMGTAVTVQAMVFGNAGGCSGAGVGFTRHPSSGVPEPWVDFLFNAQGEDVVSGRRSVAGQALLQDRAPHLWGELVEVCRRLEQALGDMQDIEFTVEQGKLWMLQTRTGKRSVQAQARIALDLLDEGLITRDEALRRSAGLDAKTLALTELVGNGVAPQQAIEPLAWGASASPGVVVGEIAFDEARARERHAAGVPVLLLRQDAETADIAALELSEGLLTSRGARTSHAAVIARQLGKVCIVGCTALRLDAARGEARIGDRLLRAGEVLTLDGNTGAVYAGELALQRRVPDGLLERLQALRSASD